MRFASTSAVARWGSGLLIWSLAGCVDSYMPDVVNAPNSYLVVDGFINGNGITRVKLSRTQNIAATTALLAETKATVYIVDDQGARYAVREGTAGFYKSDSMVLSLARQYRLHIATAGTGGAIYESELVPLKVTPPIDALKWKLDGSQILFLLSTHDAQQKSRYYRWSFIETWQFETPNESHLEYNFRRDRLVPRTTPIHTCWRTERPSTIKQSSTAQLSQDALINFPMLTQSSRSERFTIRYSVLVSQYAETAPEFAYYELLRKNTEAVGTVNDPLPTQLTGNVHRVDNAAEPVLGFVGAHTVRQQRLFITRADIPFTYDWQFDTPYQTCQPLAKESIYDYKPPLLPAHTLIFANAGNIPVDAIINGLDTTGCTGAPIACVDCRLRGSNVIPSFW